MTYAYSNEVLRLKEKLPKFLQITIGRRLFELSLTCADQIVVANSTEEKLPHMKVAGLSIERSWMLIRMLHDNKGISRGEMQGVSERLSDISKQLTAWMKWERERLKQKDGAKPVPAK